MTLRIAMIGYAFMGRAHSQAWRNAHRFFDLPVTPEMRVLCGRDAAATEAAAQRLGWAQWVTDWREVIERDDIDVVDICTPGSSHAPIALAALAAGKHVLCEKPLANTLDEAGAMTEAAEEASRRGVLSMVGFNYRRTPALAFARQLVEEGRVGTLRHIHAQYFQDWIVDPEFPMVWRLRREDAGSGALGDIAAHIVDLAHYLTGQQLTGVNGTLQTFIERRPVEAGSPELADVTVDDAAAFFGRTQAGALAVFEATRMATGRRNAMRIELNGSAGSLAFDFMRMNELEVFDNTVPATEAGFRRVFVTEPDHPYTGAWWPPGHGLGYEHTFVNEIADFVRDVAAGRPPSPSFADGLYVQRVLDAVDRSAGHQSEWTPLD